MNWHSATFSFFRFLSFDLKFLKPIGYTVCIPTTGRRLMAITWAAGEFSTNEKQEHKRKSWRSKKMPCQTNPFFLTFFRLFQSPLFLFNFKLLIFEHFWTFLTRFISLKIHKPFSWPLRRRFSSKSVIFAQNFRYHLELNVKSDLFWWKLAISA